MARGRVRGREAAWAQVRVGAVLIVALALLAYGIFQVGKVFDVFARRYELVALFPNAAGILEGSPVTLAGQRVGQVSEVEFLPVGRKLGEHELALHLSVAEEVQSQIRADSYARLRTQGLLGDRYVDVEPGSAAAPALRPGDTIRTRPTADVEDLIDTANETLAEAQRLAADLRRIVAGLRRGEGTAGRLLTDEELYRRLLLAAAALQEAFGRINRGEGTLGRLLRDPRAYERLEAALARIDSIGALVLAGRGTLGQFLASDEVYRRLLAVLGRADTAMAGLSGFAARLGPGRGTLGRLATDPRLYDELLEAVLELQALLRDVRANPRRYRPELNIDVF